MGEAKRRQKYREDNNLPDPRDTVKQRVLKALPPFLRGKSELGMILALAAMSARKTKSQ